MSDSLVFYGSYLLYGTYRSWLHNPLISMTFMEQAERNLKADPDFKLFKVIK